MNSMVVAAGQTLLALFEAGKVPIHELFSKLLVIVLAGRSLQVGFALLLTCRQTIRNQRIQRQ